jgi:large subunit ribosomal protein L30
MATRLLHIKYVKSAIGYNVRQKRTIRALGLHRLGDSVKQEDTPPIRGMIDRVQHLVTVEEVEE